MRPSSEVSFVNSYRSYQRAELRGKTLTGASKPLGPYRIFNTLTHTSSDQPLLRCSPPPTRQRASEERPHRYHYPALQLRGNILSSRILCWLWVQFGPKLFEKLAWWLVNLLGQESIWREGSWSWNKDTTIKKNGSKIESIKIVQMSFP